MFSLFFPNEDLRPIRVFINHQRGEHTESLANCDRAMRVDGVEVARALLFTAGFSLTPEFAFMIEEDERFAKVKHMVLALPVLFAFSQTGFQ